MPWRRWNPMASNAACSSVTHQTQSHRPLGRRGWSTLPGWMRFQVRCGDTPRIRRSPPPQRSVNDEYVRTPRRLCRLDSACRHACCAQTVPQFGRGIYVVARWPAAPDDPERTGAAGSAHRVRADGGRRSSKAFLPANTFRLPYMCAAGTAPVTGDRHRGLVHEGGADCRSTGGSKVIDRGRPGSCRVGCQPVDLPGRVGRLGGSVDGAASRE
jgi:hypothetical protein